jgi:purine-binding chemotaxis protein CheW
MCAIPVDRVQEVLRHELVTPVPLAPPAIRGLINLRGRIVTAVDLRRRMGLPDDDQSPVMHVILRDEEGGVSLLVDRVGDVIEVEEGSWAEPPATLKGEARRLVRGAYKLTRRLLLVLDLEHVLEIGTSGRD